MKLKFSLLVLLALLGCSDSNKELSKQGLNKFCHYELKGPFEVYLHSTDIPENETALTKYEGSMVIPSEFDYDNALVQIQENCCFHERANPNQPQYRIFVNETPNVTKISCMFDIYNKHIGFIYRNWRDDSK